MKSIGKWVIRSLVVWGAGKAWQAYQDKKARGGGYTPAK
jgi:hypothetical protein